MLWKPWYGQSYCTHRPYFFHFLIMDLTELQGMFRALLMNFVSIPWLIGFNNLFSDWLGVFFSLHALVVAKNTDEHWMDLPDRQTIVNNHWRHPCWPQLISIPLTSSISKIAEIEVVIIHLPNGNTAISEKNSALSIKFSFCLDEVVNGQYL